MKIFTVRLFLILLCLNGSILPKVHAQFFTEHSDYINSNAHLITNRNSWLWIGIANVNADIPEFTGTLGDYEHSKGVAVSDPVTGQLLFHANNKCAYGTNNLELPGGEYLLPYIPSQNGADADCAPSTDINSNAPASEHFRITGSPSQGVVIVSFLDSIGNPYTNKYISFNMPGTGHSYNNPLFSSLYDLAWDWEVEDWDKGLPIVYSIIDMNLNDGLGGVLPENLRIPLIEDNFFGEGMIAIPGNQCDIWLITHHMDSAVYYAWNINSDGVSSEPVVSYLDSELTPGIRTFQKNRWAVSPARDKVAFVSRYDTVKAVPLDFSVPLGFPPGTLVVETPFNIPYGRLTLVDFNPDNGEFSGEVYTNERFYYDVEFSTDGSSLYATGHEWEWAGIIEDGDYYNFLLDTPNYYRLYQFDPYALSPLSDFQFKAFPNTYPEYAWIERKNFSRMHKLPNGKLLFNTEESNSLSMTTLEYNFITLDNINQPLDDNVLDLDPYFDYFYSGETCFPEDYTTVVNVMSHGQNPVVFPIQGDESVYTKDTVVLNCKADTLRPLANAYNNKYEWWDGDTSGFKLIHEPGIYWVKYRLEYCQIQTDSFVVYHPPVLDFDLGQDTLLCPGDTYTLRPFDTAVNFSFLWQDRSRLPYYIPSRTDSYYVKVSYGNCEKSDSVFIEFADLDFNLGDDISICLGDQVLVSIGSRFDDPNVTYWWNTGSVYPTIEVNDTGSYVLEVNLESCSQSDSIYVGYESCMCDFTMPNAFSPNGDGLNDYFLPLFEPDCQVGAYRLHIYNRFGEMVFVSFKPEQGWDGTVNDYSLDAGVYFYEMSYLGGTEKKSYYKKGDVTLIR